MASFAQLVVVQNTDLWKSYTPEWRESLKAETPDIEWKFWMKSPPWRDCPFIWLSYFCTEQSHTGFWKHSEQYNFQCCNDCGKLPLYAWPLFVFECDECEEQFIAKYYPIHYQLCVDCGGE